MKLHSLLLAVFCLFSVLPTKAAEPRHPGEGDAARRKLLAPMEGRPAPALDVTTWVNNRPATLADFKGKIVVLDFWATWCGPCIASIPHNNALAEKYRGQDVVFIGICHPRGGDKMRATVEEHRIAYPVALDARGATIKAYQVDGYPDYYVIDRNGVLRVADCSNSKVEKVILALLEER